MAVQRVSPSPHRSAKCLPILWSDQSQELSCVVKRRVGDWLELIFDRELSDRCADEIGIQVIDGEQRPGYITLRRN
jgi:hypothetical protein